MELYNQFVDVFLLNIHEFFWSHYHESQTRILKTIYLGLLALFTPSQIYINILFICYLFKQFHQNWIKELCYLVLGKTIGLFVMIFWATKFGDLWLLSFIQIIGKVVSAIVMVYILFLLFSFKFKMMSLSLGFLTSFLFDPIISAVSKFLPFYFYKSVNSFLMPILFSVTIVTPILIMSLLVYGFEIDQQLKDQRCFNYVRNWVSIVLVFLVSLNLFFIFFV
ncbi:hypothetical protein B9L23_10770 [Parageobacillus galactosidasius]|jgi:hypothetical protein|uniref:Yip1 domain-containing protein n=1 Tax=Parageobacillus galactosidasius TaxID=883812 RepID=A0A226QII9_9BACL|nr:hypothetical protein B9L23_10770 [Parageobacillus galactosidasius]